MRKSKNKTNEGIHSNSVAIIGSIILLVGGFLLSYNYIQTKKMVAYDYMANVFYDNGGVPNSNPVEETEVPIVEEVVEAKHDPETGYNYLGFLEIPKINLRKGFVEKESVDNDVEKNLFIADTSTYPNVDKGNLIIAGHSGTGYKAFFNNLQQLVVGDQAIVMYGKSRYTYKITKIYTQAKTGTIAIYRDFNKTTLTLVTCTNNDSKTQTIYIAELVSKTEE